MGKSEDESENESDESSPSSEEITEEKEESEEDLKASAEEAPKSENKEEDSKEKKKDADNLRKVIKIDSKEEKTEEKKPSENESEESARDTLEQKRAVLQSIKDFDFQIKKNQEEISGINQKLDSVTKDLDDLVSLYEIVSEQMNPFVGLSKVTKKRIDALENFTKEIEDLKERTGELESFAEKSGARIQSLGESERAHVKTIDAEAILGDEKSEEEGNDGEVGNELDDKIINENEKQKETSEDKEPKVQQIETEVVTKEFQETPQDISQPQNPTIQYQDIVSVESVELKDEEFESILEGFFSTFDFEGQIDSLIDEFIESLKG